MSAGSLHRDERALYLKQLQHRAHRLERLAKLSAAGVSDDILAMYVWNLLKAALPLCATQLREQFFEWLGASFRGQNQLCQFCGSEKPAPEAPMCQDCLDECIELDQQQLLEDASEEGRPH